MILKNVKYLLYLVLCISFVACGNDDNTDDSNMEDIPDPNNGGCQSGKTAVFEEKDGLLTIESENASFKNTGWKFVKSLSDFAGDGYLVWNGADSFNQPGKGILTYKIRIKTPGTYRFIWRSYITIGANSTEHNDSWLRIADAKHFYGKRGDGNIVYPRGTQQDPIPESTDQANTNPQGSGSDGWFKIFMNTASEWHWQSSTSDNDGHNIFVVFDAPGDYTIEISGRSNGHGIDRFSLFTENTTQNVAINTNTVKSSISCE